MILAFLSIDLILPAWLWTPFPSICLRWKKAGLVGEAREESDDRATNPDDLFAVRKDQDIKLYVCDYIE